MEQPATLQRSVTCDGELTGSPMEVDSTVPVIAPVDTESDDEKRETETASPEVAATEAPRRAATRSLDRAPSEADARPTNNHE